MSQELVSKVWKIAGLFGKVTPGVLIWKNNQVIFITEDGVQFQTSLSGITDIKWPFLRMGMGFDGVINGEKYKFSFAKPNAAAPEIEIVNGNPYPSVIFAGQYFNDISSLRDIKENKLTTKKWKEILSKKS
ncbi:MAG TPA: hypothetical protein PLX17_05570 [Chitinophagaceae bacterium]|nr:hypothetical protein [Chitinophagaceae bacterium]